jgi:hypothetical protein
MAMNVSPPKVEESDLLVVVWSLFGFAAMFFFLRIGVRLKYSKSLFYDDGFACFALVCLLAHAIVLTTMASDMYTTLALEKMMGNKKRQAPPDMGQAPPDMAQMAPIFAKITRYLKLQFSATFLFWSCLWSVKASFLAFFKRLTNNLKAHVIAWWVIVGITVLAFVGCVISYPISCSSFEPSKYSLEPHARGEQSLIHILAGCSEDINLRLGLVSLRFSTAMDMLTDVLIIALPMSLAVRVRLPGRTKVALFGIFALGGFIIFFSAIRIIVTNATHKRPEVSWLNLWSAVEASIAVLVCNLAPFKVLFRGRIRATNSDPYRYNPAHAVEGKNMNSYELSSSQKSNTQKKEYKGIPESYSRPENPVGNKRNSWTERRKHPRRGLQTHVSAVRSPINKAAQVKDGTIVVTSRVDRKEMAADEMTLDTQRSEEDIGRTMWRHSSQETIQPLTKHQAHMDK